jgi:hypothetical protein
MNYSISKRIVVMALLMILLISSVAFVSPVSAQDQFCRAWSVVLQAGPNGVSGYSLIGNLHTGEIYGYRTYSVAPDATKSVDLYAFVPVGVEDYGLLAGTKGAWISSSWTFKVVDNSRCSGAGPGPDMVPLPEGSAMGTFVTDTPLYYAPRMDAATDAVMKAGQSLWVTGVSADGAFYQVVLSGEFLWVPVNTMSPTYTAPWNGAPLPSIVAQ